MREQLVEEQRIAGTECGPARPPPLEHVLDARPLHGDGPTGTYDRQDVIDSPRHDGDPGRLRLTAALRERDGAPRRVPRMHRRGAN